MSSGDSPAFPAEILTIGGESFGTHRGLTKRELFAAMAMQGILSNTTIDVLEPNEIAHDSMAYANALITQLNASKGEG